MHYATGKDVSQQLVSEVSQLAFSITKVWTRRESNEEIHVCNAKGMTALKLKAVLDCDPETLTTIIVKKQPEWDLNLKSAEILEQYDGYYNNIKLLTCQMPITNKAIRMCVYTAVVSAGNYHHIVYQSIDHDRAPPYESLVTIYPSGYFVSPVPGDPHRCQLISIFQFPAQFPDDPRVINHLTSSSERVIAGLRGAVNRRKLENNRWDIVVDSMRKHLYKTIHELESSHGFRVQLCRPGVRVYTKQMPNGEFYVVSQTASSLPYRSHEVAAHLLTSASRTHHFDSYVSHGHDPIYVRPNTFHQRLIFSDLQTGETMDTRMLVSVNGLKDNQCDLTYRISAYDPNASPDQETNFTHYGGYVIFPDADNVGHSIIEGLNVSKYPGTCSDDAILRESVRIQYHLTSMVGYISLRVSDKQPLSLIPKLPSLGFAPGVSYAMAMEHFYMSLLRGNTPTFLVDPKPIGTIVADLRQPVVHKNKRKYLMSVDHVVAQQPKSQEGALSTCTKPKPCLFLVSEDSEAYRLVRRRVESPLVFSNFNSLPQEIIMEVFKFLDSPALMHISRTCSHFKDLVTNCDLWRKLFSQVWGQARGRVAQRYSGDDDPKSFFSEFSDWKELYFERQYIEAAWKAPERRALSFTVHKAHSRSINSMALLPTRHRLVTGSRDRQVRVWDVTSGLCLLKLAGPASCVTVQEWDAQHVKVAYKNGVVRLYDIMQEAHVNELRMDESTRGCIFYDNRILSWHENAMLWDETTNQAVGRFVGHVQRVKSCALSSNKSILYTASRDSTVRLWDVHNQSKISTIEGHTKAVNSVEVLGNICLTGSSDKLVKAWDIRKLNTPLHTLTGHTGKVQCINYSEIAQKICTGGEDGVRIWDTVQFGHVRSDSRADAITCVAMDEESIAYGDINGDFIYYDFAPHR